MLHSIELLAKGTHENPQTTKAVIRTRDCSLKTDMGSPLSRTTYTQLVEHGGVGGVYMEPAPLCSSVSGAGRYLAGYQKRNVDTHSATRPSIYNLSSLQSMLRQWHHRTCGVSINGWFNLRHTPWDGISTSMVTKNKTLDSLETYGKKKMTNLIYKYQ